MTTSLAVAGAPVTSGEAAARNVTARLDRNRVLQFIRQTGGATADEISVGLNMGSNSVTPRVHELVGLNRELNARGYQAEARRSSERRKTRAGRWAFVIVAL